MLQEHGIHMLGKMYNFIYHEQRCNICGKQFLPGPSLKQKMERHLMTHSGEKPFLCPECPHRCSRKDSLKVHIARMHGPLIPTLSGTSDSLHISTATSSNVASTYIMKK